MTRDELRKKITELKEAFLNNKLAVANHTWFTLAFVFFLYPTVLPLLWPAGLLLRAIGTVKSGREIYTLNSSSPTQPSTGWKKTTNISELIGNIGGLIGCGVLYAIGLFAISTSAFAPWLAPAGFMIYLGFTAISNVIQAVEKHKLLSKKSGVEHQPLIPLSDTEKQNHTTNRNTLFIKAACCILACATIFISIFAPAFLAFTIVTAAHLITPFIPSFIPDFLTAPIISLLLGALANFGMLARTIKDHNITSQRSADAKKTELKASSARPEPEPEEQQSSINPGASPSVALGVSGDTTINTGANKIALEIVDEIYTHEYNATYDYAYSDDLYNAAFKAARASLKSDDPSEEAAKITAKQAAEARQAEVAAETAAKQAAEAEARQAPDAVTRPRFCS
jgi:hypothetical protein